MFTQAVAEKSNALSSTAPDQAVGPWQVESWQDRLDGAKWTAASEVKLRAFSKDCACAAAAEETTAATDRDGWVTWPA